MYFATDAQERILANFYFALEHDGFLVVGKAEALQSGRQLFKPYNLKRRVNEELETMNEELSSTNEELETMNDELREAYRGNPSREHLSRFRASRTP